MSEVISFITNSLILTALLAYIFGLWATLVLWTWFDVSSRTGNLIFRFGSVLIVATGFILGLAIYLILRPNMTKEESEIKNIEDSIFVSQASVLLCPNCYSTVREDFAFCSTCAFKLQIPCKNCNKKINVSWQICPFCSVKNDSMIKAKNLNEIPQAKQVKSPAKKGRPVLLRVLNFLLNPSEKSVEGKPVNANDSEKSKAPKSTNGSKRKKAR